MPPSFAGVSFVGDSNQSPSSSVGLPVTVSGYHMLVVNGYSRTKDTPNSRCIRSQSFKVGGHRWFIEYYPNGFEEDDASNISFYLVLDEVNNAERVTVYYIFSFPGGQFQMLKSSSQLLVNASGNHKFVNDDSLSPECSVNRQNFEKSIHLRNDSFTVMCNVTVVKYVNIGDAAAAMRFVTVPPPDMQHHIYNLLQPQEGTDVTFQVGGEKFAAHRCVLAARSAVFKAELFGPMKEGTIDTVVHIHDMEAKVFRLLLGYIYCDWVPGFEEEEEQFM
jgi:speckle-type POZ protein